MNWLRIAIVLSSFAAPLMAAHGEADPLASAQLAMAKLYGAGQIAGLEGYQSGFFIEGEPSLVVTVDSAALDGSTVSVVDAFGERYEGRIVGRDAASGLVLLECPAGIKPPATLAVPSGVVVRLTQRVWALSNCFNIAAGDEPVTLQRARIAALASMPASSVEGDGRPTVGAPEAGSPVLVLSAVTSNPGAGGGVVVDEVGQLLGVLGAECRSPVTGAWLNYALTADAVSAAIARIRDQSGDLSLDPLAKENPSFLLRRVGLGLVAAITKRTPAFVERVGEGSPAARAGVEPDDLIVAVSGATVGTVEAAGAAIGRGLNRDGEVELTVLRYERLVTLTLRGDAR